MQKYIVSSCDTSTNENINIRVTKTQKVLYREWVKSNKILMTKTFENAIVGYLNGEINTDNFVQNSPINSKDTLLNIKILPYLKNKIKKEDVSFLTFNIIDSLMGKTLSGAEVMKYDVQKS